MLDRPQSPRDATAIGRSVIRDPLTLRVLLALFSLHTRRPLMIAAVGLGTVLVACIAISRVYLGVHYPSDVVAGIGLGLSCALIMSSVSRRSFPRSVPPSSGGTSSSIQSCEPS